MVYKITLKNKTVIEIPAVRFHAYCRVTGKRPDCTPKERLRQINQFLSAMQITTFRAVDWSMEEEE